MKVKNYKITIEFQYKGAFFKTFITTEDESQAVDFFNIVKEKELKSVRIVLEERLNFEEYKIIKLY